MKSMRIVSFVLLIFLTLFIYACNQPTKPETANITGFVVLDGEDLNSEITVAIYNASIIPQKISNIKKEYPQAMFPAEYDIFFDHRNNKPLDIVFTNQEGKFSFNNLSFGEYIIVYLKEGWGYTYQYSVIQNRDVTIDNQITLYPEQEIPAFISGTFELENNKCYVANDNVVLSESAHLVINDHSRILLGDNVKIQSFGEITCPGEGEKAYITSLAGVYDFSITDDPKGDGIEVYGKATELKNLCFSYLHNTLTASIDNSYYQSLAYVNNTYGPVFKHCSNVMIEHCLFAFNNMINTSACDIYNIQNSTLRYNVLFNNHLALQCKIATGMSIYNNIFINNFHGFSNQLESECIFSFNNVVDNVVGIRNSGGSNLEILNNEINGVTGIETYHSARIFNTVEKGWTKANNNNIIASRYCMESRAYYFYNDDDPYPLDFSNNYWGTTNINKINDLIVDYHDLGLEGASNSVHSVVLYLPFKTASLKNVGVQTLN